MRNLVFLLLVIGLTACASSGGKAPSQSHALMSTGGNGLSLTDRASYSQKDKRWSNDRMGGSGATMRAEGCLVTASAMALTNLGHNIDPGTLNRELKRNGGYTGSGQLVWAGIERVTKGRAKARFHSSVSMPIIDSCLRDGYYPMARFKLSNGRTHWSMIVRRDARGFYMRDPLHLTKSPLLFPRGIDALEAIRCIGPA